MDCSWKERLLLCMGKICRKALRWFERDHLCGKVTLVSSAILFGGIPLELISPKPYNKIGQYSWIYWYNMVKNL